MVVTNETNLTGKEVEKILMRAYKRTEINKLYMAVVLFVAFIVLISSGYAMENQLYISVGYGSLVLSFALVLYYYYLIKTAPKKLKKNNNVEIQSGVKYSYTFKEQSFQVISKSLSGSRKGNYKYDQIKRAYQNLDAKFDKNSQTPSYHLLYHKP